ncbi:MAG: acetoacetate decarboxylase family protein [Chloroflexi bacterium]|nr:acetoacetate decarboxylase family protein [Chloroflexota bacterium]
MDDKLSRRRFLHVAGGSALGAVAAGCTPRAGSQDDDTKLPLYVDDGAGQGWPVLRGPYLQRNAQIAAFLLPADIRPLQQMCDRYLNNPTGGQLNYAPLMPYVVMLIADMKISSLDERDRELGWMCETELSFWVPIAARAQAGGLEIPDYTGWFLPYLYVDNPAAIATGRQVYGFPKMLAQFDKPFDVQNPEFAVDVWGFARSGPEAEGRIQRLAELRRRDKSTATGSAITWGNWDAARAEIIHLFSKLDSPVDRAALERLIPPDRMEISTVFLKQFRDVADTRRACYQAIVEAPMHVQHFHSGELLNNTYYLTLHTLQNHPLAQTLGLHADESGIVQPLVGLQIHVDFTLDHGVEVWRART